MNFLTDKDGVTKKDTAFIVVVAIYIFLVLGVFLIAAHNYFANGFQLNDGNMALLTMIFLESSKIMIIVIAAFYGTQAAVTILTKGVTSIPNSLKGILSKVTGSGNTTSPNPETGEDFIPPSDMEYDTEEDNSTHG